MDLLCDLEILFMIPLNLIIEYPNDFDDNYFENHLFKKTRNFLNVDIDVCSIMKLIGYDVGRRENGSISIYYSKDTFDRYILLDTYIGKTDQLDLISIGFRCPSKNGVELRNLVRQFYDTTCKYNIYYCEGTNAIRNKYKIDFSLFDSINNSLNKTEGKEYIFYRGKEKLLNL